MAVLQSECGFLIGKTELLGFRPEFDDIASGNARFDDADGRVHVVATAFVGVDHWRGGAADGEGPIVSSSVAVVAVQNIEKGRVAGTQHPVGVNMRMRAAAFAGNRVDAFDVLRAEIIEDFSDD